MRLAGRYDVISDLSSGGMGRLRLARPVTAAGNSSDLVVIKTAHAREDDERLRDEARVGMRLQHPHIVDTLDLLDLDGRPGLVTAYVSGCTLLDVRRKLGALPPVVICRIAAQIASALEAIHGACDEDGQPLLMLHRDVTASNIMLGHDGKARLIDLGIARSRENRAQRTDAGSVRGTLRYLAPELFGSAGQSVQTDVWSLGVVLWEALRGKEALAGPSAGCIGRILSGRLMSLDVGEVIDGRLQRAIAQLVRLDPAERPKRARDAAALFAMLEKDMRGPKDITELMSSAVSAAVGPRADHRVDPQSTIIRAEAVFGEDARLQTTGLSDDDLKVEVLMDLAAGEGDAPPQPRLHHPVSHVGRPPTAGQAILYYARLLQGLEVRR